MNCRECQKKIDDKLNKWVVDALTVKNLDGFKEDYRLQFLDSLKKDLDKVINENYESLTKVCSNSCFNKLLYEVYMTNLENQILSYEFYNDKVRFTKQILKDYK